MNAQEKGFTLIELMVTIAIIGILAAIAAPSFRSMQQNSALRSAISEWQSSFHLAQSEAMRLRRNIHFCASEGGQNCEEDKGFDKGWIVAEISGGNIRVLRDVYPPNTPGLQMSFGNNAGDNHLILTGEGNIDGFRSTNLTARIARGGETLAEQSLNISREGRMSVAP